MEDDENARTALADLLAQDGFEVATASDGVEALAKLPDFDPDLVCVFWSW